MFCLLFPVFLYALGSFKFKFRMKEYVPRQNKKIKAPVSPFFVWHWGHLNLNFIWRNSYHTYNTKQKLSPLPYQLSQKKNRVMTPKSKCMKILRATSFAQNPSKPPPAFFCGKKTWGFGRILLEGFCRKDLRKDFFLSLKHPPWMKNQHNNKQWRISSKSISLHIPSASPCQLLVLQRQSDHYCYMKNIVQSWWCYHWLSCLLFNLVEPCQ